MKGGKESSYNGRGPRVNHPNASNQALEPGSESKPVRKKKDGGKNSPTWTEGVPPTLISPKPTQSKNHRPKLRSQKKGDPSLLRWRFPKRKRAKEPRRGQGGEDKKAGNWRLFPGMRGTGQNRDYWGVVSDTALVKLT